MFILIIYLVSFIACSIHSYPILIAKEQEENPFYSIGNKKLIQILKNVSIDENFCFHCTQRHIGLSTLHSLIDKQQSYRAREEQLRTTRSMLNILSMINLLVIAFIFGGPKLISLISFLSSCSIFVSVIVEKLRDVVIFESSIILVSVVVLMKTFYVILYVVALIERKKSI